MLFDLTGKVAIVTGSSRGIGRAIAMGLASAGAKVVISSRKQAACNEVAAIINDKHGAGSALPVAANISSKAALQAMVDAARSAFGPIDILVCNAASNPYYGPMEAISDEEFRKILDNNIISNHWLITMTAPDMRAKGSGAIVIVSSVGGLLGSKVIGAYNVSKAADFQLVRNYALELGCDNIRVNAIAPGVIRTDFARALYADPATEAELCRATPLGRIGEPEDIIGAALLFTSQSGAHITGQYIVIDGGAIARGSA